MLLGQINVLTGALYAAGRPLGALRTWAWMAIPWVVGAALWMAFGKPVWLVSVLVAARAVGLLAGRAAVAARRAAGAPWPPVLQMRAAAAAIVGGAAAVAADRTELILLALALLLVARAGGAVGSPAAR